jgi:hypothetical protein
MNALCGRWTRCASVERFVRGLNALRSTMNALRSTMSDLCEDWTLRAAVGRLAQYDGRSVRAVDALCER